MFWKRKNMEEDNPPFFSDDKEEELETLKQVVKDLEKEVVFWKEKALNFRKFHQ